MKVLLMGAIRRKHKVQSQFRSRGVAMLLVLVVIMIAMIVGLSFLQTQSTTTGIAENIDRHARARQIAESGLQLAIAEIRGNEDWRTAYFHGEWIDEQVLTDGSFGVVVQDGFDEDGDGAIESDANLADDDADPVTITVTGRFDGVAHVVTAVITTLPGEEGFVTAPAGVTIQQNIRLTGSGRIDAYNSTSGSFNPGSNYNGNATVASNIVTNSGVTLTGSAHIKGNVTVGPGSNPTQVVQTSGSASVSGTKTAAAGTHDMPSITTPSNLPASLGNVTYGSSGTTTLTAGTYHYNTLTVSGSRTVNISGNVVIYCDTRLTVGGSGKIVLNSGATLTIYSADYSLSGSAKLNMPSTPNPSLLTMYHTGTAGMTLGGSVHVAGVMYAPSAKLTINGSGVLFGAYWGKELQVDGSGHLTQDLALPPLTSGGGGGGGEGTAATYTVRWAEQP